MKNSNTPKIAVAVALAAVYATALGALLAGRDDNAAAHNVASVSNAQLVDESAIPPAIIPDASESMTDSIGAQTESVAAVPEPAAAVAKAPDAAKAPAAATPREPEVVAPRSAPVATAAPAAAPSESEAAATVAASASPAAASEVQSMDRSDGAGADIAADVADDSDVNARTAAMVDEE